MSALSLFIILLFVALVIILQIGYWIEQMSNLYYNKFKSKKEFFISLIPGKMLFDFYMCVIKCFRTFRSLQ